MMLIEQTMVPTSALPVADFKMHLRTGTGFADDALQDLLVARYLRAALAAIEGRTGKALISRAFSLSVECWREPGEQPLPVAPVTQIQSVVLVDAAGVETVVDAGRYRLRRDTHRPKLGAAGVLLPQIPWDGSAEITFVAGFGTTFADVPIDLQQAVMLLAAQYYEARQEGPTEVMPFGVMALVERWRNVRILGGGRA